MADLLRELPQSRRGHPSAQFLLGDLGQQIFQLLDTTQRRPEALDGRVARRAVHRLGRRPRGPRPRPALVRRRLGPRPGASGPLARAARPARLRPPGHGPLLCLCRLELLARGRSVGLAVPAYVALHVLVHVGVGAGVLRELEVHRTVLSTALCAAGSLGMEDAVKLVEKRASLMESCPEGAMAAVLKTAPDVLEKIVASVSEEFRKEGQPEEECTVVLANFNTRQQLVISGSPAAVKAATVKVKGEGGKAIPLPVGGAFHSPLMTEAAEEFSGVLSECNLVIPECDVVQNFDARGSRETDAIKDKLNKQMRSPVRWYESVEYMIEQGAGTFVEIGPGNVLTGLVKKIDESVKVFNINDSESLKATISELRGAAVS